MARRQATGFSLSFPRASLPLGLLLSFSLSRSLSVSPWFQRSVPYSALLAFAQASLLHHSQRARCSRSILQEAQHTNFLSHSLSLATRHPLQPTERGGFSYLRDRPCTAAFRNYDALSWCVCICVCFSEVNPRDSKRTNENVRDDRDRVRVLVRTDD